MILELTREQRRAINRESSTLCQLYQQHREGTGDRACSVCALGALMMGQLGVNGDCALTDVHPFETHYNGGTFLPEGALAVWPTNDPAGHVSPEAFSPYLTRHFSAEQLQLIEIAFERGAGAFNVKPAMDDEDAGKVVEWSEVLVAEEITLTEEQVHAAVAFGTRYSGHAARLVAIMDSIAAHPDALFAP